MPKCYCFTHGCSELRDSSGIPKGRDVNARLLAKHSQDDRAARALEAQRRATEVEEAQVESIRAYIASTTLSDPIATLSTAQDSNPAVPIKEVPDTKPKSHRTSSNASPKSTPRRSRVSELQACMEGIQEELDISESQIETRLHSLKSPAGSGPPFPFPLIDCVATLDELQDRLAAITYQEQTIVESKCSLSKRLSSLRARLLRAKQQWSEDWEKLRVEQTPTVGVFHDTGVFNFIFLFSQQLTDIYVSSSF